MLHRIHCRRNVSFFSFPHGSVVEGIAHSPFQMVYGRKPFLPTDVLYGGRSEIQVGPRKYRFQLLEKMGQIHAKAVERQAATDQKKKESYDRTHSAVEFDVGDIVLLFTHTFTSGLSRKLQPKYEGPYVVLTNHSELVYTVRNIATRKKKKVNIQRLRLFAPAGQLSETLESPAVIEPEDSQEVEEADAYMPDPLDSERKEEECVEALANADSGERDSVMRESAEISNIVERKWLDDEWRYLCALGDNTVWLAADEIPTQVLREWSQEQRRVRAFRRT